MRSPADVVDTLMGERGLCGRLDRRALGRVTRAASGAVTSDAAPLPWLHLCWAYPGAMSRMNNLLAVVVGSVVALVAFALGLSFWPGSGASRESTWRPTLLMLSLVGVLALLGWWVGTRTA